MPKTLPERLARGFELSRLLPVVRDYAAQWMTRMGGQALRGDIVAFDGV